MRYFLFTVLLSTLINTVYAGAENVIHGEKMITVSKFKDSRTLVKSSMFMFSTQDTKRLVSRSRANVFLILDDGVSRKTIVLLNLSKDPEVKNCMSMFEKMIFNTKEDVSIRLEGRKKTLVSYDNSAKTAIVKMDLDGCSLINNYHQ